MSRSHTQHTADVATETIRGELVDLRQFGQGWCIGKIRIGTKELKGYDLDGDFDNNVTITGAIHAQLGDVIEVVGTRESHPKWGPQFKIRECAVVLPQDKQGIVRWLASRLPDVGENRARAIVDRFGAGDELWQIFAAEPARLCEIDGITTARASAIQAAYLEHAAERKQMVRLRGLGLTDNQVGRCLEQWKTLDKVVAQIEENPYQLASVVHGFGFKRADVIALRAGVRLDSPYRIRAAILFVLGEAAGQGHCYVAGKPLQDETAKLLSLEPELVGPQIRTLAENHEVVRQGWRVYLPRLDNAEHKCARRLLRMIDSARRAGDEHKGTAA